MSGNQGSSKNKKKGRGRRRKHIQIVIIVMELVLILGLAGGLWWLVKAGSGEDPQSAIQYIFRHNSTDEASRASGSWVVNPGDPEHDPDDYESREQRSGLIDNPTPEMCDQYWQNSCFFGDSIVLGYKIYLEAHHKGEGAMGNPTFGALIGYDLGSAMHAGGNNHPLYLGIPTTIFDIAAQEKPDKIILSFGINDLGMGNTEYVYENYQTAISLLKTICPDAQIYVVSCTNIYAGRDQGNRNNESVRQLNQLMSDYCDANGYGFIDVASYLVDGDGSLYSGYTADFFVHLNNNAYDTWLSVFRRYAYWQLSGKFAPEEMFPITWPNARSKPAVVENYTDALQSMADEQETATEPPTTAAPEPAPEPVTEAPVTEAPATTAAPETQPTEAPTTTAAPETPATEAPTTTAAPETPAPAPETPAAEPPAPEGGGETQAAPAEASAG